MCVCVFGVCVCGVCVCGVCVCVRSFAGACSCDVRPCGVGCVPCVMSAMLQYHIVGHAWRYMRFEKESLPPSRIQAALSTFEIPGRGQRPHIETSQYGRNGRRLSPSRRGREPIWMRPWTSRSSGDDKHGQAEEDEARVHWIRFHTHLNETRAHLALVETSGQKAPRCGLVLSWRRLAPFDQVMRPELIGSGRSIRMRPALTYTWKWPSPSRGGLEAIWMRPVPAYVMDEARVHLDEAPSPKFGRMRPALMQMRPRIHRHEASTHLSLTEEDTARMRHTHLDEAQRPSAQC